MASSLRRWLRGRSLNRRRGTRRRSGRRRCGGTDQEGLAGEAEASSCVVDDVDLADVEAGVQPVEGNVEGKGHGIASGHVYARGFDQRRLEYLCGSLQKLDAGQN